MAAKAESAYRQAIRASIRGLWNGSIGATVFRARLSSSLKRSSMQAWLEGAKKCGITSADELTAKERGMIAKFINEQMRFADGFAVAIGEGSKANKGKLDPLLRRGELWVGQLAKMNATGEAMACADKKAKFIMGATEKHCHSCLGLNGRVYRYSTWLANDAIPPKNRRFRCGPASHCECRLEETSDPLTKGKFPVRLLV